MTNETRVGVLGCSGHARDDMLPALLDAGAAVVAVADLEEGRRNAAARRVGSAAARPPAVFGPADDLLGQAAALRLDAVVVVLPNRLHDQYARKALERDLHVLVAGPLTDSLYAGRDLVALAVERARVLEACYPTRLRVAAIAEMVRAGAIGTLLRLHARRLRPAPGGLELPPPLWNRGAGGVVLDLGSDLVDAALRFVAGPPSLAVAAGSRAQGAEVHGAAFVDEDSAVGLVGFEEGGPVLELRLAWAAYVPSELCSLELEGTRGRLLVPLPPSPEGPGWQPVLATADGSERLGALPANRRAITELVERWIAACRGTRAASTPRELLRTQAVLASLRASLRRGGRQMPVPDLF